MEFSDFASGFEPVITGPKKKQTPEERIESLKSYDGEDRVVPAQEIADSIVDIDNTVIPTGLRLLDNNFGGGFEPGELVVVTGLSGHGKTTLLMTLTQNMATLNAAWFTLEVTPKQFLTKMKKRDMKLPVFYMPLKNMAHDTTWIEERVYEAIGKYDSRIIFIDHLHRILSAEQTDNNVSLRIARVVNALKDIANERKIIIFLVAHCRDIPKGEELHMSHIRDSGMISREADAVIGIYRVKNSADLTDAPTLEMFTEEDKRSKLLILKNRREGLQGACFLNHSNHYLNDADPNDIFF